MGSLANYLEKALADHSLGGAAYSQPGTVYIGLFTVTPDDTGGGTEVPINGSTAYARLAVVNTSGAGNWTNPSAGTSPAKANAVDFTWPTAGVTAWGTIVAFGIFDAATAGNLLYWGAISPSQVVQAGNVFKMLAGNLQITWD